MSDNITILRELLRQVLYPLDLAQALTQKSSHHGTTLSAYSQLRTLLDAPAVELCSHVFYTNADADRPAQICDRNGEVALAMCKLCGKAESELTAPQAQQPRKAVKLTDEEIDACDEVARKSLRYSKAQTRGQMLMPSDSFDWHFARAIEQAVWEKLGVTE